MLCYGRDIFLILNVFAKLLLDVLHTQRVVQRQNSLVLLTDFEALQSEV